METLLLTESDIRQRIWMELQRATHDRHHEWRAPVLATVDANGMPQARTVVLRQASAALGTLQIYTDRRSPKVAELAATPEVALAFWSKRLGWQLRVQAIASVQHTGPEVDAVWSRLSQSPAASDYLSACAPGDVWHNTHTSGDSDKAPGHPGPHQLAIITAQVQCVDWLELARSGHRRALFTAQRWERRVP